MLTFIRFFQWFMSKKNKHHKTSMTPMPKESTHHSDVIQEAGEMVVENTKMEGSDTTLQNEDGENMSLILDVAKREGRGEDAPPLAYSNNKVIAVGVFDGMGGSGAAEYTTPNGKHTGAYIASRRVMNTCLDYISKSNNCYLNTDELSFCIKSDLDKCIEIYNIKPSGLRSALIRILPTTLAMLCAENDGSHTHVYSYWSGDSRNYILDKSGLHQVSVDHLSTPQDPLENLRNDESLSNCICQDKPFKIDTYDCGAFSEPIIILSATDGCFGYLKSPMHFEYLLLKHLEDASDQDDWKGRIEAELKEISGDDFSLSLKAIDGSFEYWKKQLAERFLFIKEHYIEIINSKEEDINRAKQQIEVAQTNLYDTISSLWENYKPNFMASKN